MQGRLEVKSVQLDCRSGDAQCQGRFVTENGGDLEVLFKGRLNPEITRMVEEALLPPSSSLHLGPDLTELVHDPQTSRVKRRGGGRPRKPRIVTEEHKP